MLNGSSKRPVQCHATPCVVEVANEVTQIALQTIFVGVPCVQNLSLHEGVTNDRGACIEVVA